MRKLLLSSLAITSLMACLSAQTPQFPPLLLRDGLVAEPMDLDRMLLGLDPDPPMTVLVQFETLPSELDKALLGAKGVTFHDYIPHHTYLVSTPICNDMVGLFVGHSVRFLRFTAEMKQSRELLEGGLLPHAVDAQGRYILDVVCLNATEMHYLDDQLAEHPQWLLESMNSHRNTLRLHIPPAEVADLANLQHVKWMEPIPPPGEPEDTRGRTLHRANGLDVDYGAGRHYTGDGVVGSINDDGIVGPHIDFKGRLDQSTMSADGGNHGDMTTGIMTGAGNLDPTMKGMAYGSFVHVLDYEASMPATVDNYLTHGVTITSTSYSNGCNVGYTATAAAIDQEINDYPQILQFFSGGNNGTADCGYETSGAAWGNITGGHKSAKNVVAVANLYADDSRETSSSRGPATDGRLKPDLSANGQGQNSTDTDNTYQVGGGTSAASPGAAGVAMQLSEAYLDLNGSLPKGAIIRLVMQNTADDLGNAGPDYSFGWGRINGVRAVKAIEENRIIEDSLGTGTTHNHSITVPANVAELRVMTYWPDAMGSSVAAKALVNDLDITLTTPSATTAYPLVLDPTPVAANLNSPAVPGVDTLNNTEQVVILSPAAGTYTLNVTGTEVPMGPQDYYVTWEFIYDSVTVTYPLGGEGFVPGEVERIRWDAHGTSGGTFTVEYSTDMGSTWSTLTTSVAASARFYNWTVPSLVSTGQAMVRVSRGGKSDVSDQPFSIAAQPTGLQVDWVCPDSFQVSWTASAAATSYEVYLLGTNYMEVIGSTTGTSYVITGVGAGTSEWVSVRALGTGGMASRRVNAIERPPGVTGCVLAEDAGLSEALSPPSGALPSCMLSGPLPISVEVTNYGVNPLTGIQVSYAIDGGAAVTEPVAGTLASGASVTHTFASTVTVTTTPKSITFWTTYATDGNVYNDTISYDFEQVTGTTVSTLTWGQNFESSSLCGTASDCGDEVCTIGGGVINAENGVHDDHDWRVDEDDTPSGTTGPAVDHTTGTSSGNYVYLEASNGCFEKEAILITPCFDLTSGATAPEFSFWYHMYGDDMGELHVDALGTDLVWDLDVAPALVGAQGNIWRQTTVDLTPYVGGMVTLRIRGITGEEFSSDMALDDLSYEKAPASQQANVQGWGVQLFPNPASGVAHLSLSQMQGSDYQVTLLNPLMQPVQSWQGSLQGGQASLSMDLKSLPSGIYLVRIQANGQALTRKLEVIK